MKGDSQISICEGQLHLACASTQGQKKAQRHFLLSVAFTFQIQWISECFTANLTRCAIFQEREKDLSSYRKQEPSYATGRGGSLKHTSPRGQEEESSCLSQNIPPVLLLLCIVSDTNFSSDGTVRLKLRISEYVMEIDSAYFLDLALAKFMHRTVLC